MWALETTQLATVLAAHTQGPEADPRTHVQEPSVWYTCRACAEEAVTGRYVPGDILDQPA